jgi:hypothetical protein
MEDKLSRLSRLNEKSSNLIKLKKNHINIKENDLEIQKFMETKNLNKKSLSNVRSIAPSEVLIKPVPHNPYCSAITSQYAFDLTQISNFNVYFWTSTDNVSLNPCIEYELTGSSAINWSSSNPDQKTTVKKALDVFTTFTGTTSTVINNYENSDIVCVLFPSNRFIGTCYGPYYIKTNPIFVDNKIVYFINSNYLYPTSPYSVSNNINEGSYMYMIMLQNWGLGFGLVYTPYNIFGSTIIPGVLEVEPSDYESIGGYIQNNVFNTIMSYNDKQFFLPFNIVWWTDIGWGYPETIMPLDSLALRWLYNVQEVPAPYISTYGVQLINEGAGDVYHSKMIVGRNQTITFGSRCVDIAFYLSNQYFTFNNLNYLRFDYIRNLQNISSFYTKDIDATISVLNLENTRTSFIFVENRALTTNLTINLISISITQALSLYIMDSEAKYTITGNTVIRNKATGKTITINNPNSRPINIYFNETTITRNINNQSIQAIENKKEVNREVKSVKHECGCGNTPERDERIKKYIQEKGLDKQSVSNLKTIAPSEVIIKPIPNNPYCSSITGEYVFDLTQISNFNVYFWTSTDNPALNPEILDVLTTYSTTAANWSTYQKERVKKALDTYMTFVNTTSTVVNTYSTCDIVCVLVNDYGNILDGNILGSCSGPYFIKEEPIYVDGKVVYIINNSFMTDASISDGGIMYNILLHEWGHGLGLAHPHDNGFGSTIMPAIAFNETRYYPGIAGYIQNNNFNTVMTYNNRTFFLPDGRPDYESPTVDLVGYPQTIMPLDALALRWMYNITEIPAQYISTYGINTINPTSDKKGQSAMIVGPNQTITFGSNNDAVNFYLTNQWFTYYNLQPIKIEYNRPIKKEWSFYPRELDSTISTINLDNTGEAFIFLENRALKINLTVNINNNSDQVLNFYCMDCNKNYTINGNVYRNKSTNKTFTINNTVGATVNVYFDN